MQNSNQDRYFKKNGKTVDEKYILKIKEKEGKKLFSRWFILFLVLLGLLTVGYNIYSHPYFKISEVYISGNNKVDDTEIIEKLNGPIGKNILIYNPADYLSNLNDIIYIKEAEILKVFPNILNVRLKESYPLYYQAKDDRNYIISNDGRLEEISDSVDTNNLIKIKGASLRENVGENFTGSDASIDLIKKLEKVQYFNALKELNLENKADIGIIINDIVIKFGDLNNIDYKLKLLENILNDIDEKGITAVSIDIKDTDNPVVRVASDSFSENLNY